MLGDAFSPAAPFYLCVGGALVAALACLALVETAPAVLARRATAGGHSAAQAAATSA